jgi:spectinomycin phosphotransferase
MARLRNSAAGHSRQPASRCLPDADPLGSLRASLRHGPAGRHRPRPQGGPLRALLGRTLDDAGLPFVLCHGDIHAANILVDTNDDFWLVDWDAPLAAPRERDLLFVVGSRIARRVEPEEEQWFFEGYGPVEIACEALVYFRYERVLQDIAEIAKSVFTADRGTEETRAAEVDLVEKFFAPGGIIEAIERLR